MGLPRLTIENVWILVLELGTVYFVTGYSMLGLEPTSLACVGLSMGVLCQCTDELAYPRIEMAKAYLSLCISILLIVLAGLVLICMDKLLDFISLPASLTALFRHRHAVSQDFSRLARIARAPA